MNFKVFYFIFSFYLLLSFANCQTSSPTISPTKSPSSSPSGSPTKSPSNSNVNIYFVSRASDTVASYIVGFLFVVFFAIIFSQILKDGDK